MAYRKPHTAPVSAKRQDRFKFWVNRATEHELDRAYLGALKTRNAHQKSTIVDELRRREQAESPLCCAEEGSHVV